MFVDHDTGRPAQSIAGFYHRMGEREYLLAIERSRCAGGYKRRQMNVGIFTIDDVSDDGMQRRLAEFMAVDATAYVAEGVERSGMRSPTANAGMTTVPPRLTVLLTMSSNTAEASWMLWRRSP